MHALRCVRRHILASMGPHLVERGKDWITRIDASPPICFNGAALG